MQVDLVFFDKISGREKRGFGFACHALAKRLEEAGLLHRMVCLDVEGDIGIPREKTLTLSSDPLFSSWNLVLAKMGRWFPGFDSRLQREILFDRFISRRLEMKPGNLLFLSRPLFLKAASLAKARGMRVWVQSSIPHPLINFSLVRNEELRLGLPQYGAYSSVDRAERLARAISIADKVITLGPDIAKFTYGTYLEMVGPDRILPLKNLFSIDSRDFLPISDGRVEVTESGPVTFLHLSNINLIKGIPYLLEAWKRFQDQGRNNCRLLLVGRLDKNIEYLVQQRYADLPNFEHRGFVPDLMKAYSAADVFISSSISDNGPGTIFEAMAAGMPVISSRNCGLATLISEGKDGNTYNYNDVDELTKLLNWYAENPNRILNMGQMARRKVEGLAVDRYPNEVLEFIQEDFSTDPGS